MVGDEDEEEEEESGGVGLEGENKCICLICMQAFQLLKLSISPVAIPTRVLDRQETSRAEYQVAARVHISTQTYSRIYAHARASTRHLRPITHYTRVHPDSITRLLVTHKHTY